MKAPDVNVLVYAHRVEEETHAFYREWLDELVDSKRPFAISPLVAVGFLRIVTNRRIYATPTPPAIAIAAIDQLVARRNCVVLSLGSDHWRHVAALCAQIGATGKLVADAQHAAVAIEHGCTWVTRDSDFEKFARHGLSWEHLEPS